MLRPTATNVVAEKGYKLLIDFDSGERKEFDVTPYIRGSWYGELADESYFKGVMVDGFTVAWPHGQDLCPDEIYYCSKPVDAKEYTEDPALTKEIDKAIEEYEREKAAGTLVTYPAEEVFAELDKRYFGKN